MGRKILYSLHPVIICQNVGTLLNNRANDDVADVYRNARNEEVQRHILMIVASITRGCTRNRDPANTALRDVRENATI